jgi:sulfite reductase beta subunit-like hemoprotein
MCGTREGIDCLKQDLAYFEAQLAQFKAGTLAAADFRAYRAIRGIYEQRTPGTFMVRARFAAGVVTPTQLRALARAARDYGDGHLHLTTRQDVQVHGVALDYLCHVAGELQDADVLILPRPLGNATFVDRLERAVGRTLRPRKSGRPSRLSRRP